MNVELHEVNPQVDIQKTPENEFPSSTSQQVHHRRSNRNNYGFPKLPLRIQYKDVIVATCWIVAISATIWFIIDVVNHYNHSLHNPVAALSIIERIPMAFPALTVCNYNSGRNCKSSCEISLEHVTRVLSNGSIVDFNEMHHESKIIDSHHCVVLNNDTHHSIPDATLTGYGASYSLYFKVPKEPVSMYSRHGLQVSFHKQGTVPNVLTETNFAMQGVDNFFILTKYETKYLSTHQSSKVDVGSQVHSVHSSNYSSGTTSGSISYDEISWKASVAPIGLTQQEEGIIVVSFAYSTLNQYYLEERVSMSLDTVFGEIGAFIGVLGGLDVMKILRTFLEIPFAIPYRSVRPIWEVFNR